MEYINMGGYGCFKSYHLHFLTSLDYRYFHSKSNSWIQYVKMQVYTQQFMPINYCYHPIILFVTIDHLLALLVIQSGPIMSDECRCI